MKTIITTVFTLCIMLNSLAQVPDLDWAISTGDVDRDVAEAITTDSKGNVLVTGSFRGSPDFDPGPLVYNITSAGVTDVFVHKMDPAGNLVWVKTVGSASAEDVSSIATDANDSVYVAGIFVDSADFDPGSGVSKLYSNGNSDIFIQKLAPNGDFAWAKQIGGVGGESVYKIVTDDYDNIYITGRFSDTVDFDPGPGIYKLTHSGIGFSYFVLKLDRNANFAWVKVVPQSSIRSISPDTNGNIIISGMYGGTLDFDLGPGVYNLSSVGNADVFVLKLDPNGDFVWARSVGGTFTDEGRSVSTDPNDNVFIAGKFRYTVDFDPGPGVYNLTSNSSKVFILKLNSAGLFQWARTDGSNPNSSSGLVYSTQTDQQGYLYTHGATSSDYFIIKIDSAGNTVWRIQKQNFGVISELAIAIDKNLYTTGYFTDTVDIFPGSGNYYINSAGKDDAFIIKYAQCTQPAGIDTQIACDSFTWIDGNTYTASNNTATHTIVYGGAFGCDSTVNLDLTILNSATSTDTQTACDTYTWIDGNTYTASNNTATYTLAGGASNGCDSTLSLDLTINSVSDITTTLNGITLSANNNNASYQWLDCNNGFSPIVGATQQSFTPTTNGNYAVALTENNCTDTSLCVSVNTVGLDPGIGTHFSLYPNPTSGQFAINFESVIPQLEINIYDIRGKLLEQTQHAHTDHINLNIDQADGLYLLELKTPQAKENLLLLKN